MDYAGDRYGVELEHLAVGDNFLPEIGFVRRDNIRKSLARFRFSPRPKARTAVRRYNWHSSGTYIENWAGRVDTRQVNSEMTFEFQNSDMLYVGGQSTYEFLPQPLRIVGLTVPVGGYDYASGWIGANFGRQRRVSGTIFLERGTFYDGTRTALNITQGRFSPTPQLAIEPTYQGNWVDLPVGKSTTHLAGTRVTYTVTPTMFTSALVQYNTGARSVSANVAAPLGVPPRQRAVRRLQRAARYRRRQLPGAAESRVHRESEPPRAFLRRTQAPGFRPAFCLRPSAFCLLPSAFCL